jgi:hypothetical protein
MYTIQTYKMYKNSSIPLGNDFLTGNKVPVKNPSTNAIVSIDSSSLRSSLSPSIFQQIREFKARREIPRSRGGRARNWKSTIVKDPMQRESTVTPAATGGALRLQADRCEAAKWSFNYSPRHDTSRVACVLRKCQGVRAMNRIGERSSFLHTRRGYEAGCVHSHAHTYTHTSSASLYRYASRAHVDTRLSRGTEFIFPEEIRKGVSHPAAPVVRATRRLPP